MQRPRTNTLVGEQDELASKDKGEEKGLDEFCSQLSKSLELLNEDQDECDEDVQAALDELSIDDPTADTLESTTETEESSDASTSITAPSDASTSTASSDTSTKAALSKAPPSVAPTPVSTLHN